jgi:exodeoxyribonuclease-3
MRILSWNVNGLRACAKKGFLDFLARSEADVVAIQEVRATLDQIPAPVRAPDGWHTAFHAAKRPGYSGVGIYARQPIDRVEMALGDTSLDDEGRLLIASLGQVTVVNAYFPKGSGRDNDNSRVPYKLAFCRALLARIVELQRRGPLFVVGDFNTAHTELDLARPRDNTRNSGFLPEERAEFSRWLDAGLHDVFRELHPGQPGHYTWWKQWGGARANNVGWRIDYVLASAAARARVTGAFIWPHVQGSDHCPVGVDVRDDDDAGASAA